MVRSPQADLQSRNRNRSESAFRLPMWIVLVGGILAGLALLFLVSKLTFGGAYTPTFTGGPRAEISQRTFDYGDVKNNSLINTTFTIQNVGDKQLYFPSEPVVRVVEGCCPPLARIDRSLLNPGETAQVSLSFSMHAGMDGPHDFRVVVRSNDVVEPEQEVVVLSNWIP